MTKHDAHHPDADELAAEVWEDESPAAITRSAAPRLRPPSVHSAPVGLAERGWRLEHDSLGSIPVPADHYWGAQTQRSLEHFPIGFEHMPIDLIHAFGHVKRASALANAEVGALADWKAEAIVAACLDLCRGSLDDEFPLSVFQTGSGTHTNANVNEVLANRANQLLGYRVGNRSPVHPNDDVNMSQSTNDTFVTAMHVAAVAALHEMTLPALAYLEHELSAKAAEWANVPKIGRTHLMDATSITVGQEWSGYAAALDSARRHVISSMHDLHEVALGGTAVGTGLNTPPGYADRAVALLATHTGHPFRRAIDPFSAQATVDALVRSHSALKSTAVTLFKIANDLRWMASGPSHGLHELDLPEHEAGSSMMPGKVNPTQAEATLMVCLQVIGQDTTVAMAGAEGNFELNAFRPVVISNYLRSARLLADTARCLGRFLVHDVEVVRHTATANLSRDPVGIVTALASEVGYDRAARIARSARRHDRDVLEEAIRDGVPQGTIDLVLEGMHRRPRSA